MKITAVIMAGGRGERFWPKSRSSCPKQFLSLTSDGETMIQKTTKRLLPLIAAEDIFVVTNNDYVDLAQQQLEMIPHENIIAEPLARNTAPCIGLAAAIIMHKYEDALMIVLPSDHLIKYEDIFLDALKKAVNCAKQDRNLVTIGITPDYPETGYGYIKFSKGEDIYKVERFVEKPDINTAREYLASEQYLWNSGMFVWKASSIMYNIQQLLPDVYDGLMRIKNSISSDSFEQVLYKEFEQFKSESIDYAVMEKAKDIYTVPGSFGWDDVGSWLAVERINQTDADDNYIDGDAATVNSCRCVICADKRFVAAVGLEDIIIVDAEDALLVCSKNNAQDVKKVIEYLKKSGRDGLL